MAEPDTQASGQYYRKMEDDSTRGKDEFAASGTVGYASEQMPVPVQQGPVPGFQPTTPPVVTGQPTRMTAFDVTKMDAASLQVYSGLSGFHSSFERLMGVVHTAGGQVIGQIDTTAAQLKDNITYDELLRTLVHDNERILTKDWQLTYNKATFFDCETSHGLSATTMPVIDDLPSGAAILTNKRLLLLSAQVYSGLAFSAVGEDKKTRSYDLAAYTSDNVHYKPLPLNNFCSIELSAAAGARSKAKITAKQPCCFGICNCLGCCIQDAMKQWAYKIVDTGNYNQRTLKIGLLLPPWGRKCMLHLELDQAMPLSHARDFIAMLQQHPKLAV